MSDRDLRLLGIPRVHWHDCEFKTEDGRVFRGSLPFQIGEQEVRPLVGQEWILAQEWPFQDGHCYVRADCIVSVKPLKDEADG